jgi:enoyl-CoA hydratase/carnithine racemase
MSLVNFQEDTPGVGLLTLQDPDSLNAMSDNMAADFAQRVIEVKSRPLRALILTGAGRAFSAGGQLQMLEAKRQCAREENRLGMLKFYRSFLALRELPVPLIAAINGAAIGAGLCLASACDVRIAASEASLGFTFAKIGLHPGMGATYFLPRLIGPARAAELLLTGRVISAQEALSYGLVSRVVPSADLLATARQLAQEILSCGPMSIRRLISTLRMEPLGFAAALEHEAACQALDYEGPEFAEGVRALRERRAAKF